MNNELRDAEAVKPGTSLPDEVAPTQLRPGMGMSLAELVVTNPDANPDAITGAPGSHPVGTGIGAASAGAAGAVIGSAIPGVGTVLGGTIGAVIGAVAGGYAGKAVAESVNPTVENEFWQQEYVARPYFESTYSYEEDYHPAYRYGWQSRGQYAGKSFDEADPSLKANWEQSRDKSRLDWDKARLAARDAWDRIERRQRAGNEQVRNNLPGDQASDNALVNDPDVNE